MESPDVMAVLIDEDLLDSYLAIAALRPRRALLLHTTPLATHTQRLATAIGERLGVQGDPRLIADDSGAVALAAAYDHLPPGTHLHHTGGTGSMAAHLMAAHARRGGAAGESSSLDEHRRILRRDDGVDLALTDLVDPAELDVAVVLMLSGFVEQPEPEGLDDVHQELVAEAMRALQPHRRASARTLIDMVRAHVRHRIAREGLDELTNWANGGGLFENIVRQAVLGAAPGYDTRVGVRLNRDQTRVELDVVAVGNFRPYVISCTTGANPDTARSKLFEVLLRARQVGGPSMRAAVACTLTETSQTSPHELEALARVMPEPGSEPLVFGAGDVTGWLTRGDHGGGRLAAFLRA